MIFSKDTINMNIVMRTRWNKVVCMNRQLEPIKLD